MGLKVDCNKKQNFEVHKKLHFQQKTKANLEKESKFDSSIIEIQKRAKRSSPHPKKKKHYIDRNETQRFTDPESRNPQKRV